MGGSGFQEKKKSLLPSSQSTNQALWLIPVIPVMEEAIFMRNMVQDALRKNVKHYPEKKKKPKQKRSGAFVQVAT